MALDAGADIGLTYALPTASNDMKVSVLSRLNPSNELLLNASAPDLTH